MKRNLKFSFSLLQYVHSSWLKERINIGVLIVGHSGNHVKLKTRGWEGRVLSAYPTLVRSNFTEDLRQIKRSIDRFSKQALTQESLLCVGTLQEKGEDPNGLACALGKSVAPDMDSSYRWVQGGTGLCSSYEEQLQSLFSRYVSAYDRVKSTNHPRSDENVWTTFNRKVSERKLDHFLREDPTIDTSLGRVKFHAGYQNGKMHLIQPLSFDLVEEDSIGSKAAKWGGFAHSIKTAQGRIAAQPNFVLGKPTRPEFRSAFEKAYGFLSEVSGPDSVYLEEQSDELVDQIEEKMMNH